MGFSDQVCINITENRLSTPEEDAQGYDFFVRRLDELGHRIPVQVKGIKSLKGIKFHDGVFLVHVLRTGSPRYEWMQRDAEKMAGFVRYVILNQSDNYCAERTINIGNEMYRYGPKTTAYWIYAPSDSSFYELLIDIYIITNLCF